MRWVVFLIAWLLGTAGAFAQPAAVDVYLFERAGCPHCEREVEFLERLAATDGRMRLHRYDVVADRAHARLMRRAGAALNADVSAVPFTVVGNQVFVGYLDDATSGRAIAARITACLATECPDAMKTLLAPIAPPMASAAPPASMAVLPEVLRLPLLGDVHTTTLSLPMLTVVLGALDGFNPCAMWVLVFLLGLLTGLQDRRRMWLLGIAFVAASAAVYFLILAAWLNLLLFVGAFTLVRAAIGLVALAGGAYYLREFVLNRPAVCEVTSPERRRRVFDRLRTLAQRQQLALALGGIVLLAVAVNVVEFMCSAGIPAVYTQVLTMSALPAWQYYLYLLLYVAVFMLDDLVVLGAALATLQVAGLTGKYARWSNLIGGVVLVAIGALLLLRPEWLAFG